MEKKIIYCIVGVICAILSVAVIWYYISPSIDNRKVNPTKPMKLPPNTLPSKTKQRLSSGDPSSYSNPEYAFITNIDLDWNIDFSRKVINGTATYSFTILSESIETILLDISNIKIADISIKNGTSNLQADYYVSNYVADVGSKLTILLPTKFSGQLLLSITYETSPRAVALQWLDPKQTSGRTQPFMYSQCRTIAARSLLPCQDTPAVKFTYNATITHPKEVTVLLSAVRTNSSIGQTTFEQKNPIPSYLLAIAVGAFVSKQIGPNSKVWADKRIIDSAVQEFSDTPNMLKIAEDICGPYVWQEYDLLIMPPSFPYPAMENPCLTFVSPTLIAGDKSLSSIIANVIAHSWSGNLVTNANFEHFWLNEGFATFIEGKIIGRLDGDLARDFNAIRYDNLLKDCIENQLADAVALTKLVVDLTSLTPDDAYSFVPHAKGQTFLRYLEDLLGGPTSFEPFLRFYFNKFKYQSIRSSDFRNALTVFFSGQYEKELAKIDWYSWLYGEGMPPEIPIYNTTLADAAHEHANIWIENSVQDIRKLIANGTLTLTLTSLQKIEFLSKLYEARYISDLSTDWIFLLEDKYQLKKTRNADLRFAFMRLCIKAKQFDRVDEILLFANSNFQLEYLRPIYRDLGLWNEALNVTLTNFDKVGNLMMTVCSNQVAAELGLDLEWD